MSSHTCVQRVRAALGIGGRRGVKAGHAGTLDPFATGLLVVPVGAATRLLQWVTGTDKRYLVDVQFGATSTTDDATGDLEPVDEWDVPTIPELMNALRTIAARTTQVPPAVSAIHVDGERAYRRVRRGESIDMPVRDVRIDSLELVDYDSATGCVRLDVACGSGTYMRSIARDLGEHLGCGGHAAALRRTQVGAWTVDDAVAPDSVAVSDLRSGLELVADLPRIELGAEEVVRVRFGQRLDVDAESGSIVVVDPDGALVAIAMIEANVLRPATVMPDVAEVPA
jgi:tRNA pseudouridine55 synthase